MRTFRLRSRPPPATPRVTGLLTTADHGGPIRQMVVDGRGRWWSCEWTRNIPTPEPDQTTNEG
jgi:hypothetical protein